MSFFSLIFYSIGLVYFSCPEIFYFFFLLKFRLLLKVVFLSVLFKFIFFVDFKNFILLFLVIRVFLSYLIYVLYGTLLLFIKLFINNSFFVLITIIYHDFLFVIISNMYIKIDKGVGWGNEYLMLKILFNFFQL